MTEANALALVVDDEQQIRRFLRAGLELDGFAEVFERFFMLVHLPQENSQVVVRGGKIRP